MEEIKSCLTEGQKEKIEKAAIIALKIKVSNILESFEKFKPLGKATKKGKKVIKLMQGFVRCNLSAPTIIDKYNSIVNLLKDFKHE